eukprot:CAMPEP_0115108720 /NCGR_PEP_ID=MMETSP0227-20121206/38186_1 /TAXON_ID=89957 /ORGANISM="Polarella glacialis, Strain CCMP 1383" /LENGTH=55 /DNA_ID=CAMNT_0002507097 /DNA_START=42 /DNA_END=206 /DNA_ORIENTATION=+
MARLPCIAVHLVSLILATRGEAQGSSVSVALSAAAESSISDLGLQMDAQISKGIA